MGNQRGRAAGTIIIDRNEGASMRTSSLKILFRGLLIPIQLIVLNMGFARRVASAISILHF